MRPPGGAPLQAMKIIDVHTHAFPDNIAAKAVRQLAAKTGPYRPLTDGTVSGLLASMDAAGITSAFLLNVATRPGQADAIKAWSGRIASDRIIPAGSIHPDSSGWRSELAGFKAAGMRAVKFHPMYQGFSVDEPRMLPVYEAIRDAGMFAVFHSGYDIVFPGDRRSSPDKFGPVLKALPGIKIVLAHFGGWSDWEAVLEHVCGRDVFIETSFIREVPAALRDRIFSAHDRNRFLFGSDCPWGGQAEQVRFIESLKSINDDFKEGIFHRNASLL